MITVYGAPPTRALRLIWMLEEMGLPYEVRPLDMRNRRQDAEFMAASPSGAVPGFADGEVRMMESVAVLEYLGARHGPTPLVVTAEEPEFPLYLQFLHYGEASLASQINVAVASRFFAPEGERENFGAKIAVEMVVGRWGAVAAQLHKTPHVAGERFTAADISCVYGLRFASIFGFEDRLDPVLPAYFERMTGREAYQRAQAHATPLGFERRADVAETGGFPSGAAPTPYAP